LKPDSLGRIDGNDVDLPVSIDIGGRDFVANHKLGFQLSLGKFWEASFLFFILGLRGYREQETYAQQKEGGREWSQVHRRLLLSRLTQGTSCSPQIASQIDSALAPESDIRPANVHNIARFLARVKPLTQPIDPFSSQYDVIDIT